ncbi:MAG: PqqD family protein [Acidobacteria bacterium]|nr:PqqD family protein [Acidobacteriota bacterium]
MLQVETGRYFGLDEAAHRMWRLILQHGDLRLVEEALRSEYAVEPERLDEPGHLLQQFPIHRTALQAHHTTSCYAAARHEVALTPQIFT